MVYLTFDDGPNVNVTPRVLDVLKQYDVKATFFVIYKEGEAEEALYKRSLISKMLEKLEFVFISEDDERIERYREVVIQGYDIIKNNDNDLKRITKVLSSLNDMLKENML